MDVVDSQADCLSYLNYMARIFITSLAICLLLLSAGKSYASAGVPASNGSHDVVSMQECNVAEVCVDMESGLFSHFQCHLNMASLITYYSSTGLIGLPSPDYKYQFSINVHIQTVSTKPPLLS